MVNLIRGIRSFVSDPGGQSWAAMFAPLTNKGTSANEMIAPKPTIVNPTVIATEVALRRSRARSWTKWIKDALSEYGRGSFGSVGLKPIAKLVCELLGSDSAEPGCALVSKLDQNNI